MSLKPSSDPQGALGKRNREGCSGVLTCVRCQVAMSRRGIGPDDETGLVEVTYRCPKCGVTINRSKKN
jgi:predicted RNA-binding Zn-ribbon protein involved in translation (DUF1610 family)